jgi:sulfite reductase alpha subunit-like flavoprotein
LELLMMHTSDLAQREALRAQASMSTASSAAPALIDVLRGASSCRPPFRALVETLRPLQPRYYSLASAALHDPQHFSFAFRLVAPRGVCTSWLHRLCAAHARGEEVVLQVGLRTAPEFRLPPSDATPIVMIGPGTGVTPFISFLEHRLALLAQPDAAGRALGEAHLFFGAKNSAEDFLFEEELEYFCEHGALQQLHTAFSQEASGGNWFGGFYVQDRLWEFGLHLAALMRDHGAHVYVCGDAQSMAQDVHRVLLEVLVEYGGMVVEQARAYLVEMQKAGRYQRDIWG